MGKTICANCIGETYLSEHISKTCQVGECDFCLGTTKAISLENLSILVDEAFDRHYQMVFPQPPHFDQPGEEAKSAIMDAAGLPEIAAEGIRTILEDLYYDQDSVLVDEAFPYSADMYYSEISIDFEHLEWEWNQFAQSLKYETRFFNSIGYDLLSNIFNGLNEIESISPNVPIFTAGPGTEIEALYRARVFQSEDQLKAALVYPDIELGPPPRHLASAGRMNANGISVFYGAEGKESAVSEVRPPVGSEVMVARFTLLRPLRLLDLAALPQVSPKGSIFDPTFKNKLSNFNFLKKLGQMMAVPVLPDHQSHEFLVTQAICDFLASNSKLNLDGIIYPSVQSGENEKNVILFHKSAKVELLEIPEDIEVSAECRDYAHGEGLSWNNYVITETKMVNEQQSEKTQRTYQHFQKRLESILDLRNPSLSIDPGSIEVHEIRSVTYPREVNVVQRQQSSRELGDEADMPF